MGPAERQPVAHCATGVVSEADGTSRSIGYPYGTVPRLLLTWLSTEAVRTKTRDLVLGESLSDFMRQLGMQPTGGKNGTIHRLRTQAERLFQASLSVRWENEHGSGGGRMGVASTYQLWKTDDDPHQITLFPSVVRLSGDFFDEVTQHPVPLDLGALRALRGSPMRLDIYCWLTYRMSYLGLVAARATPRRPRRAGDRSAVARLGGAAAAGLGVAVLRRRRRPWWGRRWAPRWWWRWGLRKVLRAAVGRTAWVGEQRVASSADVVVVEGNVYFPASAVRAGMLTPSPSTSVCPWKGVARYYTVTVDGVELPDAAWTYRHPLPLARRVKGRIAF